MIPIFKLVCKPLCVFKCTQKTFQSVVSITSCFFFFLNRNGSVVVFFTIIFNDLVSIDDAILVLVNASENGTLGDLEVERNSIKAFQPVVTTPATSSPTVTATTSATSGNLIWDVF